VAGYIFSLDNLDSLNLYTQNGVYATKLSPPTRLWGTHHEGTFADYATMQKGDNIYFFIKRKIYGVGKLVSLGSDCKFNLIFRRLVNLSSSIILKSNQSCFGMRVILALINDVYVSLNLTLTFLKPALIWTMFCPQIHPHSKCSEHSGSYHS